MLSKNMTRKTLSTSYKIIACNLAFLKRWFKFNYFIKKEIKTVKQKKKNDRDLKLLGLKFWQRIFLYKIEKRNVG